MSSDPDASASEGPIVGPPQPDTLEQQVFAARLEARLLGTDPELPRIDRFVLERMIGAGGMGRVWLAHDETLDRRIALKLVQGGRAAAGERMRLREARGLARIAHPNVIAVYDVGEHEGRVWLAMEYVPGRTLRECARELSRDELLAHWLAAGRGLAAIHAADLVHRDIKPDNVLLGDDGRVRVIDLGLVRASVDRKAGPPATPRLSSEPSANEVVMTPGFVGTRSYAPPEQQRGEGVDARADQYAFCVALLESLRAAKPGPGASPSPSPSPSEPLSATLLAALARGQRSEPDQRFASMAELLAALELPRTRRVPLVALALGSTLGVAGLALGLTLALAEPDPANLDPAPNPDLAWTECLRRAAPVCTGRASEVIELVLTCADPACDTVWISPTAALLAGERLPFDVDVDNRTPRVVALRWRTASRSGLVELGPGRRPLPPHWDASDLPICVELGDATGEPQAVAIALARDCD